MTAQKIDWNIFLAQLKELAQKGAVVENRGFFFLPGSAEATERRIGRILWENEKMKIAQRAAKILSLVPFIKLIAVCNTLSFGVSQKESDIDFFIVARAGRLWLVRALSGMLLFVFRLYRRGRIVQNQVCLSFFIADTNLNLRKLALAENSDGPDIYLIYWITQLIPLINREQTLEKFWFTNEWISVYLANWDHKNQENDYRCVAENKFFSWIRSAGKYVWGGFWGDRLEYICKRLQLFKMRGNITSRRFANGTDVVVSDEVLKFHEQDRRELFRKMWKENLESCQNL